MTIQFVSSLDFLSTRAPMLAHDERMPATRSHGKYHTVLIHQDLLISRV
jgi:hypothetical protein